MEHVLSPVQAALVEEAHNAPCAMVATLIASHVAVAANELSKKAFKTVAKSPITKMDHMPEVEQNISQITEMFKDHVTPALVARLFVRHVMALAK
jgi:hypothetical protein